MARKLFFCVCVLICVVIIPYLLNRWKGRQPQVVPFPLQWRWLAILFTVPFLSYRMGPSQVDDSYIYDRYILNALAGHGLVYNFGEHVNALSSPIFAYVLLFASWVAHGNVLLASVVMSAVFMLLACLLAEWLVPFAGILLASTAYFYMLTGMETSFFAFMLLVETALFLKGKYSWLPVISVLLALTRFEGAILVAVVLYQVIRRKALPGKLTFLPAAVVIIGYLLLNHLYYGVYLPSSAIAKLGQGFSGYWGPWPTAFLGLGGIGSLHTAFEAIIFATPVLIGLAVAGLFTRATQPLTSIAVPFLAILLALYVGLNMPGNYYWYFAPFILFILIYVASAIPPTRLGYIIASITLAVFIFQNALYLRRLRPVEYWTGYVEAGHWLAENTPANATLATDEIGYLGWYSHRYIIDSIGLTTPKNAVFVAHHDSASWLAQDHPDYILMHQTPWFWEVVAANSPNYVREPRTFTGGVYFLRRKDYAPTLK